MACFVDATMALPMTAQERAVLTKERLLNYAALIVNATAVRTGVVPNMDPNGWYPVDIGKNILELVGRRTQYVWGWAEMLDAPTGLFIVSDGRHWVFIDLEARIIEDGPGRRRRLTQADLRQYHAGLCILTQPPVDPAQPAGKVGKTDGWTKTAVPAPKGKATPAPAPAPARPAKVVKGKATPAPAPAPARPAKVVKGKATPAPAPAPPWPAKVVMRMVPKKPMRKVPDKPGSTGWEASDDVLAMGGYAVDPKWHMGPATPAPAHAPARPAEPLSWEDKMIARARARMANGGPMDMP